MNNCKLLITSDSITKNQLKKLGFQEIPSSNVDIFIFVNDITIAFTDDIDISKIKYSNKLFY